MMEDVVMKNYTSDGWVRELVNYYDPCATNARTLCVTYTYINISILTFHELSVSVILFSWQITEEGTCPKIDLT